GEPTLINIAYSYEQATNHRRLPTTTPPLPGEEFEYKYKSVPEPDYVLGTIAFASLGVGYQLKRKKKR
ncbi:MAG: hypothetical protein ICV78_19080, partial [Tolypothrix sp. Co-bin9]|nr:hypothetical protein [Tolypothrix sp. Co-bin9]